MIKQLNPSLPVITPKGKALAHFLIDDGIEHDLKWICFQDNNGECWTWSNRDIRAQKNVTAGREYISPFYDPGEVALKPNSSSVSKKDFKIGDRVKVICEDRDFNFFSGETGVIEDIIPTICMPIKVKFDQTSIYLGRGKDEWRMGSFWFHPGYLCKISEEGE